MVLAIVLKEPVGNYPDCNTVEENGKYPLRG